MSRVIGCFLIVLLIFQQVFCQQEFQRLVIERLEKLEKENVQLKTRLAVYENNMSQMTANMQKIGKDVIDLKSNWSRFRDGRFLSSARSTTTATATPSILSCHCQEENYNREIP